MTEMIRKSIHVVAGTLECVTGLHIGGSQDELQIGGTDNPVIKHPVSLEPYVPGSSLKGKMRGELEKVLGKYGGADKSKPCDCLLPDCPVCRIFGPHSNAVHDLGPTRIIVRDARLVEGGEIEVKAETAISRKTGAAARGSLRPQERVVAGSKFHIEIRVQVYDVDDGFHPSGNGGLWSSTDTGDKAILAVVRKALALVEETGLGAGTSRGSGQVRFTGLTLDGKSWQ